MGGSTNVALHSRRDRARRGHRLLERGDEPGRVQRPVASPACRGEHAAVRAVLDGRRRRHRRCAGRRAGNCSTAAGSTGRQSPAPARRSPSRSLVSIRRRPTATWCSRCPNRSSRPAACGSSAATSRPKAARSSRSPVSRAASSTVASSAGRGCSSAKPALIAALEADPDSFEDGDMVVIRYEGPRGAPGMPEMLDPTSRITTLCRQKGHHDRLDDRRRVSPAAPSAS